MQGNNMIELNEKKGCLYFAVNSIVNIIVFIVILVISPYFISPIIHDLKLYSFANNLYKYPLPENTTIIEKTKTLGSLTGGNGKYCDFLSVMRVSSSLSKEELQNYYDKAEIPPAMSGHGKIKVEVFLKEEAERGRAVYEQKRNLGSDAVLPGIIEQREYIIQIFDPGYSGELDIRCH